MESQVETARKAIAGAKRRMTNGDARPASMYGQMAIAQGLVAVAESVVAVAVELEALRALGDR